MLITSKNNNHYFLDCENRSILLLPPQLKELLREDNNLKSGKNSAAHADNHYIQKYLFLIENGYLSKEKASLEFFYYSPDFIRNAIANSTHIVFEVTERCNLKCKYCGYGEYYETHDERHNGELSFKKAKLLLDYLYKYWNSADNISYGKKIN